MGRGKGGSSSHEKRTPGGIRTSSKMSQVGEIEAKDGVLGGNPGDVGAPDRVDNEAVRLETRRAERDLIQNAVNNLLRRQFGEDKDGNKRTEEEYQRAISSSEGLKAQHENETRAKEYVRKSSDLQAEIAKRVKSANLKKSSSPYATPNLNVLENYYYHSDRTPEEINQRFKEEGEVFKAHVGSDIMKKLETFDENQWGQRAGFLGRVYHQAKKDPSKRELFLKLWSLSGDLEDISSAPNSGIALLTPRLDRETKVAAHLKKIWEQGKSVADESPESLQLDEDDPLASDNDNDPVYDIHYYKLLLSDPVTRQMLMSAEKEKSSLKSGGRVLGHMSSIEDRIKQPYSVNKGGSIDSATAKAAIQQKIKPFHELSSEDINSLRAAVGQAPDVLPEYAEKALEKQPISKRLMALAEFDDSDISTEEYAKILGTNPRNISIQAKKLFEGLDEYKSLTDLEKYALSQYTSFVFEGVNGYLRTLSSSFDIYSSTKDEDVKKAMLNRIHAMMEDVSQNRAYAVLTMRAMAKVIAAREPNEARSVSRGSVQAPDSKIGLEEGKYFYDPGVSSTTLYDNWNSPYASSGTQLVLTTNQWVDARDFSIIDRGEITEDDEKEHELMLFPGTVFRADFVKKYKSTKLDGGQRFQPEVVIGRQANLAPEGVEFASAVGKKWESPKPPETPRMRDLLPNIKGGRRDDDSINEYTARFSDLGGDTLFDWLYGGKTDNNEE